MSREALALIIALTCPRLCESLGYLSHIENPKNKSRCLCVDAVDPRDSITPSYLRWAKPRNAPDESEQDEGWTH